MQSAKEKSYNLMPNLFTLIWEEKKENNWKTQSKTLKVAWIYRSENLSEFRRQSLMIFLSFRVFGLLSSSALYSQHFGQCVLLPSSGVFCQIQESTQNFKPYPLFNPQGGERVACLDSVNHNQVRVLSIPVLLRAYSQNWTWNLQMIVT